LQIWLADWLFFFVIPAQAGIQDCPEDFVGSQKSGLLCLPLEPAALDPRLRGDDGKLSWTALGQARE